MREAGADRARVELGALVVGGALGAPEPVGVQQPGGLAAGADRQPAAQVELDEPVADAQQAELLDLRGRVERRRGLDVLPRGQGYLAGSSAESASSAVESTSAAFAAPWSKPAAA